MFQALQTLLAACASLAVTLVSNGNGTITVTVIPKSNKGGEDAAALNTPLSLTGTPEELDAEFAGILAKYTDSHKSLGEQLEATEAILAAAKKEAATKATKVVKKAATQAGSAASSEPESEEEDDDDKNDGKAPGGKAAPEASATAAAPAVAKPADNLWGE